MATTTTTSSALPPSKLHFHVSISRSRTETASPSPSSSISLLRSHLRVLKLSRRCPTTPRSDDPNGRRVHRSCLSNNSAHGRTQYQPLFDSKPTHPLVQTCAWNWRGYRIRYQFCGSSGPALVLVHGFGANCLRRSKHLRLMPQTSWTLIDHWQKNIAFLLKSHRVYSIDLIGYGYSDKPNPRELDMCFYSFETWATQLNEFCIDVVKDEAFFICNSIGGLVGLQAAVMQPQICKGIILLNISLRMLHIKKQPWYGRPLIRSFQSVLRNTALGKLFYKAVATPESVRNILCQCYHDSSQVTEELIEKILLPGLEPGAAEVFLEFICYSDGPLPEELLPQVKCPVLVAWGDKDPWEPIELGRAYSKFDSVEDFVVFPDVGHCPQDEAPHLVNPLIESFVGRHAVLGVSYS